GGVVAPDRKTTDGPTAPRRDHVGFVLDPVEWGGREKSGGPLLRISDAADIAPGHPVD
ncbi:flavin reductase, partial [Streptomyces sp. NPDC058832]